MHQHGANLCHPWSCALYLASSWRHSSVHLLSSVDIIKGVCKISYDKREYALQIVCNTQHHLSLALEFGTIYLMSSEMRLLLQECDYIHLIRLLLRLKKKKHMRYMHSVWQLIIKWCFSSFPLFQCLYVYLRWKVFTSVQFWSLLFFPACYPCWLGNYITVLCDFSACKVWSLKSIPTTARESLS